MVVEIKQFLGFKSISVGGSDIYNLYSVCITLFINYFATSYQYHLKIITLSKGCTAFTFFFLNVFQRYCWYLKGILWLLPFYSVRKNIGLKSTLPRMMMMMMSWWKCNKFFKWLAHSVSITMLYSIIAWKHLWSLWATNSYTSFLLKDIFWKAYGI